MTVQAYHRKHRVQSHIKILSDEIFGTTSFLTLHIQNSFSEQKK